MTPEITLLAPPSSSSRPLGSLWVVISESGLVLVRIQMFHKFPYCAYNSENGAGRSLMAEYQSWGRVWIFWIDCNFILLSLHFPSCETGPLVWNGLSGPFWVGHCSQSDHWGSGLLPTWTPWPFVLGNHDSVTIRSSWVMWFENLHWLLCEFSAA